MALFGFIKENVDLTTLFDYSSFFSIKTFLIFVIINAAILFICPKKIRNSALIIISTIFVISYSTIIHTLFLLLFLTLFYIISNMKESRLKKISFPITIFIFLLSPFFISQTLNQKFSIFFAFAVPHLIFRIMQYFFDIRNKRMKKVGMLDYFAFLTFFPIFLQGPIERFQNFAFRKISILTSLTSIKRILTGLIKLAITKFILVDIAVLTNITASTLTCWKNIFLNSIVFYFTISGFIDIIIGSSLLMGYRILEDFPRNPYLQSNLTDFWRNWRMSIMLWLKDYVYIPLGGNKKNKYFNLIFILLLIGLWHSLPFWAFIKVSFINLIAWGLYCGIGLIISKIIENKIESANITNKTLKTIITISGTVATLTYMSISWVILGGVPGGIQNLPQILLRLLFLA